VEEELKRKGGKEKRPQEEPIREEGFTGLAMLALTEG